MLDINFIRQNLEKVKQGAKNKGYKVDFDRLLGLDEERRELIVKIDKLRAERKKLSKDDREKGPPSPRLRRASKKIKEELQELEPKLKELETDFKELMYSIPNLPAANVKVGKDESENEVLKKEGKITLKKGNDHIAIGRNLDLIDTTASAKASGSRFCYLKNEAVLLELALINFAFDLLSKEGFKPIIPPQMLKNEVARETGYYEKGDDDSFYLKDVPSVLIGTSEHSILAYHRGQILDEKELPKRYVGFSTCFRREAGSYGKDVKGILRVHQFDKVEMVSFTAPEDSEKEHQYFLSLEEKIMKALKIPYQVVRMCTGDLGIPAADKIDIEAWMPGQERYRETHSTSNCTDFQARRLNIKYRAAGGNKLVHTINGTAIAIPRPIIAILENYQQRDGSVKVPKVLQKYCGFSEIK